MSLIPAQQTALGILNIERAQQAGQVANVYAASGVFADYRSRKAKQTTRRQAADLHTFAEYRALVPGLIANVDAHALALAEEPASWQGVTWGLVAGFVQWMLGEGYAVGTVNIKLSTVKTYAKLAFTAGAIAHAEFAMIQTVTGYRAIEGRNVDQTRETTRKGYKKAEHTRLTHEQVTALKTQPDTPQGRRDALLMCLLLDHGLRVSEVADLVVTGFDLKAGMMAFHRRKVNKTQTHRLTPDAKRALAAYVSAGDIPAAGQLLRASGKAKKNQDAPLTHAGMSTRAITKRVAELGAAIGVTPLSAHDCRHAWATRTAKRNPDNPLRLQEAGGWNSLAMPRRYIEAAAIANEGLELE